jgi:hypothetical protein
VALNPSGRRAYAAVSKVKAAPPLPNISAMTLAYLSRFFKQANGRGFVGFVKGL